MAIAWGPEASGWILLVDPDDGQALAVSGAVLHEAVVSGPAPVGAALTEELTRQQIETNTRPCRSLDELGSELRRWRRVAASAAAVTGARVALATSPLPVVPSTTPKPRYGKMIEKFGLTAEEQLSCALLDEGMIYFDARLSRNYPTVEVRVADVCLYSNDAVLLAGLTRALVETAARAWRADQPPAPTRVELLRLAAWQAARSGLDGDLIDPTGQPVPAQQVVRALIEHVTPALEDFGDLDALQGLTDAVLGRGNGATLQREVCRRGGSLADVVAFAVTRSVGA